MYCVPRRILYISDTSQVKRIGRSEDPSSLKTAWFIRRRQSWLSPPNPSLILWFLKRIWKPGNLFFQLCKIFDFQKLFFRISNIFKSRKQYSVKPHIPMMGLRKPYPKIALIDIFNILNWNYLRKRQKQEGLSDLPPSLSPEEVLETRNNFLTFPWRTIGLLLRKRCLPRGKECP